MSLSLFGISGEEFLLIRFFFYLSLFSSIKSFTGTSAAAGGTAAGTAKTATAVGGTQLIVQNPKNLQQSTVSLQQIVRQQSNQIVLGKRIIPVSVSSQNARQTIQVNHRKFETGFKFQVRCLICCYFSFLELKKGGIICARIGGWNDSSKYDKFAAYNQSECWLNATAGNL